MASAQECEGAHSVLGPFEWSESCPACECQSLPNSTEDSSLRPARSFGCCCVAGIFRCHALMCTLLSCFHFSWLSTVCGN